MRKNQGRSEGRTSVRYRSRQAGEGRLYFAGGNVDEEEDNKHGAPASAQGRNMMGPRSLPSRPHHSRDLSDHGMHLLKRPSFQPYWRPLRRPSEHSAFQLPYPYLIGHPRPVFNTVAPPSARRTSGRTDGRTDVRRHQVARPATDLCLPLARSATVPNRITFDA